jgi:hypothetical protein
MLELYLHSSATCPQTLSGYVPPLMSETKFESWIFTVLDIRREDKRQKVLDWMVASITRAQFPPESNFSNCSNRTRYRKSTVRRRNPSRWPRSTLYSQKLALTSPTIGGRSVGIVRSRTQATEFSFSNNYQNCWARHIVALESLQNWISLGFELLTTRYRNLARAEGFSGVLTHSPPPPPSSTSGGYCVNHEVGGMYELSGALISLLRWLTYGGPGIVCERRLSAKWLQTFCG